MYRKKVPSGPSLLITFPVLLAVGLPPVVATASNLVAVSAGNFLAAFLDRRLLPPFNRAFVSLVIASLAGAVLGAVLLLATPTRMFEQLIPVLLAKLASILVSFVVNFSLSHFVVFRERPPRQNTGP